MLDVCLLNDEQNRAVRKLENALKACKKAGLNFHNCYGTLFAYDKSIVEAVDDDEDEYLCGDALEHVSMQGYDLGSWADDKHWIHLTPKGKELNAGMEDETDGL